MTEIRKRAFVGIVGLVSAGLFSIGCGSSGNTTGTAGSSGSAGHAGGGSTGSAGTTGTGGTTGSGGTTGTGGGSALCTGGPLTGAPLVTDFSDVTATDGGTPGTATIPGKGGISGYGGVAVAIEGGHAHATGSVTAGTYAGVSLYFSNCVDATTYTGVQFTLTGSFGTCDMLKMGVNFPQDEPLPPASGHGTCPASPGTNCYGPGSVFTTATTMVTFANMSGGGAVATVTSDAQNRLTGIGWGFHGPAAAGEAGAGGCTVDFTIDDVKFF